MKAPRSSSAYQHAKLTRVDDQRLRDQQLARVRFLIAEVLRDEGIEVMEVGHAQAALDSLEQHAARIHVLFTDIQMPGPMDGLALAHHTSKNWALDRAAYYLGASPTASNRISGERPVRDEAISSFTGRAPYSRARVRAGVSRALPGNQAAPNG
jgi:CheY-like chemotaxis protein